MAAWWHKRGFRALSSVFNSLPVVYNGRNLGKNKNKQGLQSATLLHVWVPKTTFPVGILQITAKTDATGDVTPMKHE